MDLRIGSFNEGNEEVSPLQAIKRKCLYDCCAGETTEYRECPNTTCWLHPFRFGKNPYRKKKELTEEQINDFKERMIKSRNK